MEGGGEGVKGRLTVKTSAATIREITLSNHGKWKFLYVPLGGNMR